jgi:hypothetical protein
LNPSDRLGHIPHVERQYVHGTDSGTTIEQIDAELMSYTAAVGRFPVGSPAYDAMMEKVDALSAKRRELEAQPSTPSGWQSHGCTNPGQEPLPKAYARL